MAAGHKSLEDAITEQQVTLNILVTNLLQTIDALITRVQRVEQQACAALPLAQRIEASYREDPERIVQISAILTGVSTLQERIKNLAHSLEKIRQNIVAGNEDQNTVEQIQYIEQLTSDTEQTMIRFISVLEIAFYEDD